VGTVQWPPRAGFVCPQLLLVPAPTLSKHSPGRTPISAPQANSRSTALAGVSLTAIETVELDVVTTDPTPDRAASVLLDENVYSIHLDNDHNAT
jgi:hypothetical protein